jgi:glycerol-3-phosphate dehydrogenase (NAD(P)+)
MRGHAILKKKYEVGVIGAGAWGTVLAKVIAEKGHRVTIWCFEQDTCAEINEKHTNSRYLPDTSLPGNLRASTDLLAASRGKDFLLIATPSAFVVDTVKRILGAPEIIEGRTLIGIVTKGFVPTAKGVKLIVETIENYLPGSYTGNVVYISGPSMASEVAMGKLTGLISASSNALNSIKFRKLISSDRLVVFSSLDVIGVQVSAAVKNIIAIAFGMLETLTEQTRGFGANTESLLIAAGLNEIQLIGQALGSTHPETFTSIAGVGDLDVTCRSVYGRNRKFGREILTLDRLTPYSSIDDLIAHIPDIGYYPEGILAAQCVHELAKELRARESRIWLPISDGVYKVLNKELDPMCALDKVLSTITRGSRAEPDSCEETAQANGG